jgi:hypothetical protein
MSRHALARCFLRWPAPSSLNTTYIGKNTSPKIHLARPALTTKAFAIVDDTGPRYFPLTYLLPTIRRRATSHTFSSGKTRLTQPRNTASTPSPPDDLLMTLVNHYFREINIFCPLLHRPTFVSDVVARRHYTDRDFAPIVLLVCAIGARFSDDPRVLVEGTNSRHSGARAGLTQDQFTDADICSGLAGEISLRMQSQCLIGNSGSVKSNI